MALINFTVVVVMLCNKMAVGVDSMALMMWRGQSSQCCWVLLLATLVYVCELMGRVGGLSCCRLHSSLR